jgi:hypothetical protein
MQKEPAKVLYSTAARINGIGLDAVAHETLRGIQPTLGPALAYDNWAPDMDPRKIKTLRLHLVKLLSNLERRYYYDAKKKGSILPPDSSYETLNLPRSELLLVGQVHPEIKPYLKGVPDSVKLLGFQKQVEKINRQSSIFVFRFRQRVRTAYGTVSAKK